LGIEEKLIKRTNKAELYRLSDGSVLKQYTGEKNAMTTIRQDQYSLLSIEEYFGEVHHEGWLYSAVKFLRLVPEREAILMEFVPGCTLLELPKSKINEAEYHCGIWLAFYHNKVFNGSTKGLVFTDFTVNNIILSFEQQSVIALDPGWAWGRVDYIYRDLIRHIISILLTLIVRRKASFSTVLIFLRGYVSVTEVKLNFVHYYKGLYLELVQRGKYFAARSKVKLLSFILITCVLSLFYLVFVPGYLFFKSPH
jgi:hypothetical protein